MLQDPTSWILTVWCVNGKSGDLCDEASGLIISLGLIAQVTDSPPETHPKHSELRLISSKLTDLVNHRLGVGGIGSGNAKKSCFFHNCAKLSDFFGL